MSRKNFCLDRRRDVFSRSSPLELGFAREVCLVPILIVSSGELAVPSSLRERLANGDSKSVGSEEARCRASLRPPLKLYVPVSGIQLSRRRS